MAFNYDTTVTKANKVTSVGYDVEQVKIKLNHKKKHGGYHYGNKGVYKCATEKVGLCKYSFSSIKGTSLIRYTKDWTSV